MANMMLRNPLTELQREVDRLFESFLPQNEARTQAVWAPPVDVWESDDTYFLAFDLPGMTKAEVDITYQDGMLQVSGERNWTQEEKQQVHRLERPRGHFFRSIRLDRAVNAEGIQARFSEGVLTVQVPKLETVKPRRIEIS
jgi:HSP20 family protein